MNELRLSDIYMDQNYWLRIKLPIESMLKTYRTNSKTQLITLVRDSFFLTNQLNELYDSYKHLTHIDLVNLTKNWCFNRISNFEYLLVLNCLAGKKLECPYNHPIFPWITDFTSKTGNLRDLTQSKFRLNKGDAHLDMTYQASSMTGGYHLTEFLSEISYFVYKSRITDKETLCNHVRRTWVPNEYPMSMSRLYLWTPEECIPEFFYDIKIFKSIHEDMPDLKLPDWAQSPEDFIRAHRSLLESEHISKNLHHWIDLVFGYKLSGDAAIEAKNVCLPLIDNHQSFKTHGIVQLFNTPHPVRCVDKVYHGERPPNIKNKYRNSDEGGLKSRVQSVTSMDAESKKNSPIPLPDDYNPLEKLEQIETMLKFVNKSYHCLPDDDLKKETNDITFEDLVNKDLKCLACILCEIIMFNKLKCLPQCNSIESRYAFICKTIIQEPHIITGPFQPFILSVLKPFSDQTNKSSKSPRSTIHMENILKYQSHSVNISKLLNPHLTILPFKLYFENLFKFNEISYKLDYLIAEYKHLDKAYMLKQLNLIITQTGFLNLNRNVEDMAFYTSDETPSLDQSISIDLLHEQKFYLALLYLPKLMFDMSDPKKNFLSQSICVGNESYELILQYLVQLFENANTCVNSFLFLFNKLTKFLSRNEMVKRFLPILVCVLNIVDLNETMGIDVRKDDDKLKFCKLFDYTFLNELRIIYGLDVFLTEIFPFLIEAISGFKDFEFDDPKCDNVSSIAFGSFQRIIPTLGPVLTCKFCCNDLFKMLAICYMNSKCLVLVENSDNPLNSCRALEGDRFAYLILESLKTVAMFYGEQVIVVQYLPYVSNTVSACVNRLSIRLEASLLAGIVLVNFFLSYLDIKLLMDELTYIINQILIPVINLYSNSKMKFPNGYLMRQALAFKTLDILLLLSLRIGPEQTRILMEQVLRAFFSSFSQVRSNIMNPSLFPSRPIRIDNESKSTNTKNSFIKARASIMSFNNQRRQEPFTISTENKELIVSDDLNSFDEYLKFSYDPSTNEIIDSPLKTSKRLALSSAGPKYRTQSFGLLSLNNEEDSDQFSPETQSPRDNSAGLNDEMANTFTCELAHTAYLSISRLTSGNYIDGILKNGDLIHRMCLLDEQANKKLNSIHNQSRKSREEFESRSVTGINITQNSLKSKTSSSSIQTTSYGSSFSEHVGISGNQIQINTDDLSPTRDDSDLSFINSKFTLKFSEKELKEHKSKVDSSRHLSENWLAYWENEIRSNNKGNSFDFKHINLLTLTGHTSSVKCVHSLDNESSFISGSKDKTVKLWSLKTHGGKKNQQNCQWTYNQHKKPITSVLFIESLRVCVSCDGSVHVWNPFAGKKLFQFDNQIVTCMSNLPSPSSSFVVATIDNYVKFIDLRTKSLVYELRTCYAPSGSIKSISASDNLLLVGFSTGLMSLLDMRTGWIQESCKALDNEILQLKFFTSDKFICSYNDGSIAISSIKDKVQVQNIIKVYNEPVPFMSVNQNQLITATGSNKIGIHSNIEKASQMTVSINKLQPDLFKGVITSQTYLPLNRLLLLGSDSGDIKLIC
ncbi:unnamed protein product [Brachionus calyciflorus]|uniref:BEACH domain-containing protein n=1 Tax=Brachionus calyciflorus TaxID=104777 RepID=A0A813WHI1_9BILA|nr:unnamed protein product [Brachionus calyciflorus]